MSKLVKTIIAAGICATMAIESQAQAFRNFANDANRTMEGVKSKAKGGGLSEADISEGLHEALQIGAQNATKRVSSPDGFFGNALIKILMPPEAKKVENTLRQAGMGGYVDNAILSMNRAAEDASAKALPIFVDAIKSMTIQDGMKILKGNNNAATEYLKSKTTDALTKAFLPVIKEALDKTNATKYWAQVFDTYNALPTTFKKINPDLPAYVTERALNGVFVYIAEEEAKIRANPAAQVTDMLKKVFGDQH